MTTKIGIILTSLNGLDTRAFKYLVLYQNSIQNSYEFSFLPTPYDSPFISTLESKDPVNRQKIELEAIQFIKEYRDSIRARASGYDLACTLPDTLAIISTVKFSDNYYKIGGDGWDLLALGNWDNIMAPPSIVEFFMHYLLHSAADSACAPDYPKRHYTTKGCLFDFNAQISDARYGVLTGFICGKCAQHITNATSETVLHDTVLLAKKQWIGSIETTSDVAAKAKKLGYDLFHTSGIKQTTLEKLKSISEQELVKLVFKLIGGIILAGLLLFLGLKK